MRLEIFSSARCCSAGPLYFRLNLSSGGNGSGRVRTWIFLVCCVDVNESYTCSEMAVRHFTVQVGRRGRGLHGSISTPLPPPPDCASRTELHFRVQTPLLCTSFVINRMLRHAAYFCKSNPDRSKYRCNSYRRTDPVPHGRLSKLSRYCLIKNDHSYKSRKQK